MSKPVLLKTGKLALNRLQYERERIALGEEIRTLRKSKKVTGVALAGKAGMSQSKLSKIETGALLPSTEDLQSLCSVLKPIRADEKRLIEQARALRTEYVSWRFGHKKGFGASQIEVAEAERQATRIRVFQVSVIPGLLQIPAYARCVMNLANVTHQSDLERAISLRVQRQQILYEPQHKFDFLITEPAALSRFCDPRIVIQQLDRLRFLFDLPNIRIGFISGRTNLPAIPQNSFVLLDSSIAMVETVTGEVSTVDERDIETYNDTFNALASVAVFGSQADPLIEEWKQILAVCNGTQTEAVV